MDSGNYHNQGPGPRGIAKPQNCRAPRVRWRATRVQPTFRSPQRRSATGAGSATRRSADRSFPPHPPPPRQLGSEDVRIRWEDLDAFVGQHVRPGGVPLRAKFNNGKLHGCVGHYNRKARRQQRMHKTRPSLCAWGSWEQQQPPANCSHLFRPALTRTRQSIAGFRRLKVLRRMLWPLLARKY